MLRTAFESLCGVVQDMLAGYAIKAGCTTVLGFVFLWIGGRDKMVDGLILLISLDFVLGWAHGFKLCRLSRDKFYAGLAKYLLYYAALLCAWTLDTVLNFKTESLWHGQFRDLLIIYFCVHETLSILQHLTFFGVPVPAWLTKRLQDYRDCKPLTDTGRPA